MLRFTRPSRPLRRLTPEEKRRPLPAPERVARPQVRSERTHRPLPAPERVARPPKRDEQEKEFSKEFLLDLGEEMIERDFPQADPYERPGFHHDDVEEYYNPEGFITPRIERSDDDAFF